MALLDQLKNDVSSIISTKWAIRKGQVVPTTDSVALAGGAVELDATFLYADLVKSSQMARDLDRRIAAKILKSFLATTTRLIRRRGGTVLSFDGDRVLGIFVGSTKNSSAAKCALQVKWTVRNVIREKFEANYDSVKDLEFSISHGVGIDTGTVLVVRAGARGGNDLISIGRAAGLAAKLSDLREGTYNTFITASVYNKLSDESKYGGAPKRDMWERRTWKFIDKNITVYRSSFWWKP